MRARKYTERFGAKREERQQSQKATRAASSASAVAEVATHANRDYKTSEKDLSADHTIATHDNCDDTPSARDSLAEHPTASAVAAHWTGHSWEDIAMWGSGHTALWAGDANLGPWTTAQANISAVAEIYDHEGYTCTGNSSGDDALWGYADPEHWNAHANWEGWPTEQACISAVAEMCHQEENIGHSEEQRVWNAPPLPICTGHTERFTHFATEQDFLHGSSKSEVTSTVN